MKCMEFQVENALVKSYGNICSSSWPLRLDELSMDKTVSDGFFPR